MNRFFRSLEIGDKWFGWVVLTTFIAFLMHKPASELLNNATSPQPWLELAISVEDFSGAQDPFVAQYLQVKQPVQGWWSRRISQIDGGGRVCSGSGFTYLDPGSSGRQRLPLSEFVRSKCNLPPGTYEVCTIYDLTNAANIRRSFGPFCDEFRI